MPEVRNAANIEDLYRRVQLVIFAPMALINCWFMKLPPWLQIDSKLSNEEQIMPGHKQATDVVRRLFELRMSLIPYLYAAFNEYRNQGIPPIRPLVMDWPEDPHTAEIDTQFMCGPSLMVTPLQPGHTSREIYLPAGKWHDLFTHQVLSGGQMHTIHKAPEQPAIFVKDGAMLPLAKPVQHVAPDTCFELTLHIYGIKPTALTLYEDDGVSLDYRTGQQSQVEWLWRDNKIQERRRGKYQGPARYKVVGHSVHV